MSGSGTDHPAGAEAGSSPVDPMLLDMANTAMDDNTTTFDEHSDHEGLTDGTLGVNISQDDEMGEMLGATEGSSASTRDPTGTGDGDIVFERFNNFPLEIRSMIWIEAARDAKPCGVYKFTYKMEELRAGPIYIDLAGTVRKNLDKLDPNHPLAKSIRDLLSWSHDGLRILTYTPSAAVADMTRGIRSLLGSCAEGRAELMRSGELELGSSFEFHYMKGGRCNLGTMRPFHYDTDWISMSGLSFSAPAPPGDLGERCTPDIGRIQHLALDCAEFDDSAGGEFFGPWGDIRAHGRNILASFRWFDGLKSVGLYVPTLCIRHPPRWEKKWEIPPYHRPFIKGFLASPSGPMPGSDPGPSQYPFDDVYQHAHDDLFQLVDNIVGFAKQRIRQGWPSNTCDFSRLNPCFLTHVDSQMVLDQTQFKEDGSHLDHYDLQKLSDDNEMEEWIYLLRTLTFPP